MKEEHVRLLHEVHAMMRETRVELGHIKEQVIKTNGRVNKNTDDIIEIKNWKARAMTVWAFVVLIAGAFINKIVTNL